MIKHLTLSYIAILPLVSPMYVLGRDGVCLISVSLVFSLDAYIQADFIDEGIVFIKFHKEIYSVVTGLFLMAMLYGQVRKWAQKPLIYRPNSVLFAHIGSSITSLEEVEEELLACQLLTRK